MKKKKKFGKELKATIFNFLKPWKLWKMARLQRKRKVMQRSLADPQLKLYSRMVRNDMLHYGYFEDPDTPGDQISMADIERAQVRYAENITDLIANRELPVFDVGCGTGGLSNLMMTQGIKVEALTPDKNQVSHIQQKYPELLVHQCKFEAFPESKARFGTIINSESFQYISLDVGMAKVGDLLLPDGQWIICDYFRIGEAHEKSGHKEEEFLEKAKAAGWKLVSSRDITPHILPTLRYIYAFSTRVVLPFADFGIEKFKYKAPGYHYLSENLVTYIHEALHKNIEIINPERFAKEKKYVLMVLEKA